MKLRLVHNNTISQVREWKTGINPNLQRNLEFLVVAGGECPWRTPPPNRCHHRPTPVAESLQGGIVSYSEEHRPGRELPTVRSTREGFVHGTWEILEIFSDDRPHYAAIDPQGGPVQRGGRDDLGAQIVSAEGLGGGTRHFTKSDHPSSRSACRPVIRRISIGSTSGRPNGRAWPS
jgi:hypothetical protein